MFGRRVTFDDVRTAAGRMQDGFQRLSQEFDNVRWLVNIQDMVIPGML